MDCIIKSKNGQVSKETVQPLSQGTEARKFGIKGLDAGQITTVEDSDADASSVSVLSERMRKG